MNIHGYKTKIKNANRILRKELEKDVKKQSKKKMKSLKDKINSLKSKIKELRGLKKHGMV